MQNPVEGLLKVYEYLTEVLLVLEMFLTKDSWDKDLFCGVPSCSEAYDRLLCLRPQSLHSDSQHDFVEGWGAGGG